MRLSHKVIGIGIGGQIQRQTELYQAVSDKEDLNLIEEMVSYREKLGVDSAIALNAVSSVLNERIRIAKLNADGRKSAKWEILD